MNLEFSDQPGILVSVVSPLRGATPVAKLSPRDPAVHGMTDFTRTRPISIAPQRPIDEALADMIRLGVRALLVGCGGRVAGLITSYDIEGMRPARRGGVRVVDVMTGWDDLPTICWTTMQSARIADLLEIFEGVGVMHLVVVEDVAGRMPLVRGLVCRSRIEKRLSDPDDDAQRYQLTG